MEHHKQAAQRTSDSLTAAWERRTLPRIARRLPAWVTPDHLTGLGVVAAFVIAGGFIAAHADPRWLLVSVLGLALHWFGDSLDGTLARVRRIERERYGYFVDRIADALSTLVIGVGIGLSPFVSLLAALTLVIGYLSLQIFAEVCAYASRRFPLSFARFGPTEARIGLAALTLALIFWRPAPVLRIGDHPFTVLDVALFVMAGVFFAVFVASAFIEAKRLDREDRCVPSAACSTGRIPTQI